MIDSGMFTKSTIFFSSEIESEQINFDDSFTIVNKATMYHLVSAHIYQIFNDQKIEPVLKEKFVHQFGFKLGYNIAEQECLGFVKYCYAKPGQKSDNKQFVGEMKVLNSKIWNILVGNKGKLFAINNELIKSPSYKIEDKQFTLGKSTKKPANAKQKQFHKLLIEYCNGFLKGALDKFDLHGQIICAEGTEGSVYAQMKELSRKSMTNNYNEYSKKIMKDNNFLQ